MCMLNLKNARIHSLKIAYNALRDTRQAANQGVGLRFFTPKWLGLLGLSCLVGCTTQSVDNQKIHAESQAMASSASQTQAPEWGLHHVASMTEMPGQFAERLEPGSEQGDVTVSASGPINALLQQVAGKDYAISYVNGVDVSRPTTVSVRGLSIPAVLRVVAANAGYVAVVDENSHNVLIADQAAWTFRIPVRLLQRLSTRYGVDGSGAAGSSLSSAAGGMAGGGSAGSGGQGSGTVGGVQTQFNATSALSTNGSVIQKGGLDEFLQMVAGEHAFVSVSKDTGYVSVRGNGVALNRLHRFLNQFVYDNDRRVDIKVSVVEVSLDDASQFGIDWSRVLSPLQNSSAKIALSGGGATLINPSLTVNFTTASIASVINALRTYAKVSVLTQPSVTAMNRSPVAIFDGTSIPYLGSITTTSTLSSTATAAAASFVESGVSLSVMPDILSDDEAQITLSPVVSNVSNMQSFSVSGSTLTAPETVEKRVLMQTVVHNGETVILGGIRTGTNNSTLTTLPLVRVPLGDNADNSAAEVVILLQSTVVPPRRIDTLVAESL